MGTLFSVVHPARGTLVLRAPSFDIICQLEYSLDWCWEVRDPSSAHVSPAPGMGRVVPPRAALAIKTLSLGSGVGS